MRVVTFPVVPSSLVKEPEVKVLVVPVKVTTFPVVASSLVKEPEVTLILGPTKEPENDPE